MLYRKLYSVEVLKNLILLEFYVSAGMSPVFSHGKGNCCVNTNLLCQRIFFHYSIACCLIVHSINWSCLKQKCQYFNIPLTFHTGFWHVMTISNLDSCAHSFELLMYIHYSTQCTTKDLMGKTFVVFANFCNIAKCECFPWKIFLDKIHSYNAPPCAF